MGILIKYANSAAVETALDKGVQGYDKAVKNETDILTVSEDLTKIAKCRLGHFSPDGQYIALHQGTTDFSVKYQDGFNYAIMDVVSGEKVHLYTVGGNNARAYGFVNSEGTIIEVADVDVTIDEILTVPDGAVKIVVNTKDIATAEVYVGRVLVEEIDELGNRLNDTNDKIQDTNSRIENISNRTKDIPCFEGFYNKGQLYINSADKTGKTIYFPVIAGNQYVLTVEGDFNRFIVFGANEITNLAPATLIHSAGNTVYKNYSYSYSSDGTYAYIGVTIAYNYDSLSYTATAQVGEIGQPWKINGIELYSKDETDTLMSSYNGNTYEQYISDTSVSVLPTTTSLYTLYDELVTNHSDYITKNLLGADDFGNNVYEYVFTSGNYNSQEVRRSKDAEIEKPVILLVTGVHGYERTSIMATYQFLRDLCNYSPKLMAIRENLTFKVIPCANPWSFDNNTRWNGNGVNINRNFDRYWTLSTAEAFTNDYSGASPADQKETQIVQSWIESNTNAVLYIDYHNSGYEDEVAYLGGVVGTSISGLEELKKIFLKKSYEQRAYLIDKDNFAADLIFGYVGNFSQNPMSYYYAENKGLLSCCLECSWNQNYTGQHSNQSIKTGAEELGNFLIGFYDEFV